MVQRKVSNTCHDDNKTDKSSSPFPNNMKPSSGGGGGVTTSKDDLLKKKTTMIKKSRSFKRSESDTHHHLLPSVRRSDHPAAGKPKPKPKPPQSPSKIRHPSPSAPQRSLPFPSSPNYMKSTTSSKARKDQRITTQPIPVKTPSSSSSRSSFPTTASKRLSFSSSSTTSTSTSTSSSHHHKLSPRSSLTRTSSLKKFRTLTTKSPTFKLSRTSSSSSSSSSSASKCASKVVLFCDDEIHHKATCSSTLKDSKFPPYLDLHPGGTESQGTSIAKVCPYTYCSLNGHHHKPSIPLRCFLASRRRVMKTQKSMKRKGLGVLLSPRRAAAAKGGNSSAVEVQFEKAAVCHPAVPVNGDGDEFFVEIYAEGKEEHALKADEVVQVTLKNDIAEEADHPDRSSFFNDQKLNSMIDSEDGVQTEQDVSSPSSDTTTNSAPNEYLEWDISMSVTLEELFSQSSDMEWDDDGRLLLSGLQDGIGGGSVSSESDYYDQAFGDSPRCEILFLEQEQGFEVDDDCVKFLEDFCKDDGMVEHVDHHEEITEQFSDFDDSSSSDDVEMAIDGLTAQDCNTLGEDHQEQLISIQDSEDEAADPARALEAGSDSQLVNEMEAPEHLDDDSKSLIETENSPSNNEEAEAERASRKRRSEDTEEQSNSGLKKHCSMTDKSNEEPQQTETDMVTESNAEEGLVEQEIETKASIEKTTYKRGIRENANDSCASKIKIVKGRRAAEEEQSNDLKDFNPREPNFLPLEAEPDAEKVDLRHQEMEARKNAEEWMVDFALRKTVDKLGPAKKKKVALLVEAFEKVMPAYRFQTHTASVPSGFLSPGRLQACN